MGYVEKIKKTWSPEDTARTLGAKLGITRQAVTGYYNRNPSLVSDFPLGGTGNVPYQNEEGIEDFNKRLVDWLPFLRKIARRMERRAQDREDLVNETVAVSVARRRTFNPSGSFPAWLAFQMRERVKHMRRQRSVSAISYSSDGDGGAQSTVIDRVGEPPRQDNIVELSQALERMEGRGKTVLLRRAMGDELHDIGDEWGITRERVRQIEARAREKLRAAMGEVA